MKYINKEYGFAFRPPFFDKFREQSETGPKIGDENYPRRCIMGVGYDYEIGRASCRERVCQYV